MGLYNCPLAYCMHAKEAVKVLTDASIDSSIGFDLLHLQDAALARSDRLQQAAVLRLDEQAVVLLVLGAPDLQHTHRVVAQCYGAHVYCRAQRIDDLLHLHK